MRAGTRGAWACAGLGWRLAAIVQRGAGSKSALGSHFGGRAASRDTPHAITQSRMPRTQTQHELRKARFYLHPQVENSRRRAISGGCRASDAMPGDEPGQHGADAVGRAPGCRRHGRQSLEVDMQSRTPAVSALGDRGRARVSDSGWRRSCSGGAGSKSALGLALRGAGRITRHASRKHAITPAPHADAKRTARNSTLRAPT